MSKQSPEQADQAFFSALIEADVATLGRMVADDFVLIDVMTGSQVSKSALLEIVAGGQLRFERIDRLEHHVRIYATTAVVTGSTEMQGRFGEQAFHVRSRYTHVFVDDGTRWCIVTAQGTQIVPSPPGE